MPLNTVQNADVVLTERETPDGKVRWQARRSTDRTAADPPEVH